MKAKQLFERIDLIGECLMGDGIHILDLSDECPIEESKKYRIYIKSGYCIDVSKEYVCNPDEINQFDEVDKDGYSYNVYTEWDGFEKVDSDIDDIINRSINEYQP